MNRRFYLIVQTCLTLLVTLGVAWASPPGDFPRFQVPGHEKEMATVRDLSWLHYPGARPKATLWDEWLPDASLWPAVSTENKIGEKAGAGLPQARPCVSLLVAEGLLAGPPC